MASTRTPRGHFDSAWTFRLPNHLVSRDFYTRESPRAQETVKVRVNRAWRPRARLSRPGRQGSGTGRF
eukprot:1386845-Amorphochlora_amoeboformis.AAC.1